MHLFVNGRAVKDKLLLGAVRAAAGWAAALTAVGVVCSFCMMVLMLSLLIPIALMMICLASHVRDWRSRLPGRRSPYQALILKPLA